jgi:uncharacterized protein YjbJ (UPF0337 family)
MYPMVRVDPFSRLHHGYVFGMGITDKVTGKAKQAIGDITGDDDTRREGQKEELKGEKKDQLAREDERADRAEERADEKAKEVADLERQT